MSEDLQAGPPPANKPAFWGLLGVGFIALAGGILMFLFVVPRDMADTTKVPRELNLLFTQVFMEQVAFHNEFGRYAAALSQVKADPLLCEKNGCRLTVPADGKSYIFRLTTGGQVWGITEKMPVPKEMKE